MEETKGRYQAGSGKSRLVGGALTSMTLVLLCIAIPSCKKERSQETGKSPLTIRLHLIANGTGLRLGHPNTNDLGEDYTVSAFKFYLSNFSISGAQGASSAESESYHLADASDSSTLSFQIMLDTISFDHIHFMIGVDSLRNVSGAQTGALDPIHGMFWTWNSGYIMAKLEGSSPSSPDPGQRFQYHIGGYAGAEATQRPVSLSFPGNRLYLLQANKSLTLTMDVDLDKWFRSAHDLPIAAIPFMETPGPVSVQYADNYANMFSVTNIFTP